PEPRLAKKEPERGTGAKRQHKSKKLHNRKCHHAIKEIDGAEISINRANIRSEYGIGKLLDQDREAECCKDRNENITIHHAEDHRLVDEPAHAKHYSRRKRQPRKRWYAPLHGHKSDIAAQHHKLTLHNIDYVEHTPDKRHAISRQRED